MNPTHLLVVKVNGNDLRWGKRRKAEKCPIARAIQRTIPEATGIFVDKEIRWKHRGRTWKVKTPDVVLAFNSSFDRGQPVGKFTFTIYLLDVWVGSLGVWEPFLGDLEEIWTSPTRR